MGESFLLLEAREQRELLLTAAARCGRRAEILEKDHLALLGAADPFLHS